MKTLCFAGAECFFITVFDNYSRFYIRHGERFCLYLYAACFNDLSFEDVLVFYLDDRPVSPDDTCGEVFYLLPLSKGNIEFAVLLTPPFSVDLDPDVMSQ